MLIAGNWKMYKGPVEAREFCARLRARLFGLEGVDVIVCPSIPSPATGARAPDITVRSAESVMM